MKHLILGMSVMIMVATSCATVRGTLETVSVADVTVPVIAATIADLDVSEQKISYTYQPGKEMASYGEERITTLAIAEALKNNGNADVLVEPRVTINWRKKGWKGYQSVTVTGYPAKYKNFRPADNETLNRALENGTLLPGTPSIVVNTKSQAILRTK